MILHRLPPHRFRRTTAQPSPLRMVLLRAPAAALQSNQRFVSPRGEPARQTRIQLNIAPRVEVHLHSHQSGLVPVSIATKQATLLTRVVQQTVRSTLRHATRIERSHMTVDTAHTRWLRTDGTAFW